MFHKNAANPSPSELPLQNLQSNQNPAGLSLVRNSARRDPAPSNPLLDLVVIAGRRCSSFFAEAAVLVLVFGILDYFMLRGRIALPWICGALAISLLLLTGSIAMDFAAHRWIKAHP